MDVQISKSHRTALFIAPGTHSERTSRLRESLNGQNIKVDIYQPVESTTLVVKRVDGDSYGNTVSFDEFDVDAAIEAARDAGYDQILVSVPA